MIIVRHTPGSALGLFRLSRRSKGLRIPYELRRRMWVAESVIYKTGSMPQGTLGFSASRPVISRGFYLGIWIKSKHKGMHCVPFPVVPVKVIPTDRDNTFTVSGAWEPETPRCSSSFPRSRARRYTHVTVNLLNRVRRIPGNGAV
jgi:hypothetical protein